MTAGGGGGGQCPPFLRGVITDGKYHEVARLHVPIF